MNRDRVVSLFGSIAIALVPVSAAAALVPCGGPNDATAMCNLCQFGVLVQNVINFLLGMSIPIAAGLFAYAGILYFTSGTNPGNVAKAKRVFRSVFIGFLIAISGWTMVHAVLNFFLSPAFLGGVSTGGSWYSLTCTGTPLLNKRVSDWLTSSIPALSSVPTVSGSTPSTGSGTTPKGPIYTDAEARAALAAAGINVNATQPQTSLEGIQQSVIDEAIALHRACGCDVTITGGTETNAGHSTAHLEGYKLDYGLNEGLSNYIQNNGTYIGTRSDGARQYQIGNAVYARESNHWDALYQ